jgi:hypothetical protein
MRQIIFAIAGQNHSQHIQRRFIDNKRWPQKHKEGKESKKREERERKGEEAVVVACSSPPKFRFRIEEFPEVSNPFSCALADRGLGYS